MLNRCAQDPSFSRARYLCFYKSELREFYCFICQPDGVVIVLAGVGLIMIPLRLKLRIAAPVFKHVLEGVREIPKRGLQRG